MSEFLYYPYFRGKQFELIAIRELAVVLADAKIVPIIEPVRESLTGLARTLSSIADAGGQAIVIANPRHGDHQGNVNGIPEFLSAEYRGHDGIRPGILLESNMSTQDVLSLIRSFDNSMPALVHYGFTDAKSLAMSMKSEMPDLRNIFMEPNAGLLYRRHFAGSKRILIRDGFVRQKNSAYPPLEDFSDLHVTYQDMGMDGFGDFQIVGDGYSESGGPAYAVALHLTFIDDENDDIMYVRHFISDSNDTPTDPAGKFSQALSKLVSHLESDESKFVKTSAIDEFVELHVRGHFPGLGYVKKLALKHHIETLAYHGF